MRAERFPTQERLLASTRMDGHEAVALDTKNRFTYVTGYGWSQDVPVDGVAGDPIVVESVDSAGQRVIASGERRQLVPEGTAGQVVTYDEQDQPEADEPTAAGLTVTDIATPIDFSSGSETVICNRTIPGGVMGANGFIRLRVLVRVVTNASRVATFSLFSDAMVVDSRNMTSSANEWWLDVDAVLFNLNDEASQRGSVDLKCSLHTVGAQTSSNFDEVFFGSASVAINTADAWALNATVQASGAIVGSALVYGVSLEYGYVA